MVEVVRYAQNITTGEYFQEVITYVREDSNPRSIELPEFEGRYFPVRLVNFFGDTKAFDALMEHNKLALQKDSAEQVRPLELHALPWAKNFKPTTQEEYEKHIQEKLKKLSLLRG